MQSLLGVSVTGGKLRKWSRMGAEPRRTWVTAHCSSGSQGIRQASNKTNVPGGQAICVKHGKKGSD